MKKQVSKLLVAAMLVSPLAACQNNGQGGNSIGGYNVGKQEVGAVLGGATGALVGSQFGGGNGRIVTTAMGTLLGAYLGSEIGKSLDQADMAYYNQTSQSALESRPDGQTSSWRNPNSGASGTVTPTRTYVDNGQNCREYSQTISVGGKSEKAYGTACRQADGSWKIVQ